MIGQSMIGQQIISQQMIVSYFELEEITVMMLCFVW